MKALGITAMILAVISIFVPLVGPYLTILCALLAAFSAGPGITFGAVAILVNVINVSLLSPSLWIAGIVEADKGSGDAFLFSMGVVFIAPQAIAGLIMILLHMKWKKKQAKVVAETSS